MIRTVLVVLACAAALAAGNPAAGVKEWRWTPRHATVSPNVMALPFSKLVKTYTPTVRITGAKAVVGCGQAQDRINGGVEAIPHSYPWQVALFIDELFFCSGAIINEEWVLTAAHCMDGARSVEVVAGAHNINNAEATQVTLVSTDFFVHENWGSILLKNDLSLIRLPQPLTWTDAIAPVCLPSYSDAALDAGTFVELTGWGSSSDDDFNNDVLREVTVPIVGNPDCEIVYGGTAITDNNVCTDTTGGRGNGDSGGPMNYVNGGKTYIRGVVSFFSSTGFDEGYPDVMTRVINYLDWIETNTGIAVDP